MSELVADEAPVVRGALDKGTRFARYRVLRVLGDGASGIVYEAECEAEPAEADDERRSVKTGDHVALKIIHRHLVKDRQISRRFLREARILSRLRGENLVDLVDFGEADGRLFMALELVQGTPLDRLARAGPMDPERAIGIVRQVCCALEVAHGTGVVHRDLKPGNVIVANGDGRGDRVHVLDFGMAKMLRADASQSLTALTEQNMVFGTPEYMAPEQARGDEVDARADVYAAGVILYELLTGDVPFGGATPISIMTAHLMEDPPPPSSRTDPGRIPPALEAVVLHALAKRPADRYPSATALATALASALARPRDVASTAPPPPAEPELGIRDTDHAIGYAPTMRFPHKREISAPVAEAPEPGSRLWLVIALLAAAVGIIAGVVASLAGS